MNRYPQEATTPMLRISNLTVDYCKKAIDPSRLFGFMTAPWRPTLPLCLDRHKEAIGQVARAMKKFKA